MVLFWAFVGGAVLLPLLPFRVPRICLFEYFLGIPCPVCGIRSSIAALLHGNWHRSLLFNEMGPFVLAVCVVLAVYFTVAVVTKKCFGLAEEVRWFKWINGVTFGLLSLRWCYKLLNY
jgi:hypothetical protein